MIFFFPLASAKKDPAEDKANSRKRKGDDGDEDSDPDYNAAKRLKEEPDEKEDSAPSESPDSNISVEKPSKGLGVEEKKGGSTEINEGTKLVNTERAEPVCRCNVFTFKYVFQGRTKVRISETGSEGKTSSLKLQRKRSRWKPFICG
jgi:hypothetical protein